MEHIYFLGYKPLSGSPLEVIDSESTLEAIRLCKQFRERRPRHLAYFIVEGVILPEPEPEA